MPLFACKTCGVIENTALSNLWLDQKARLCSRCDPTIGEWHGQFPRKSAVLEGYVTSKSLGPPFIEKPDREE